MPAPSAASTCGCRCSAPPPGWARWPARWPAASRRWSSLVGGAGRGCGRGRSWSRRRRARLVAPWPGCCSWRSLARCRRGAAGRPGRAQPGGRPGRRGRRGHGGRDGRLRPAHGRRSARSFAGDQVVWRLDRPRGHRPRAHRRRWPRRCWCSATPTTRGCRSGATVRLHGRLVPADDRDLAALLRPSGDAEVVGARRACGGGPRPRCGRRCATRWRTGPPTSGRWCRRWSTATTPSVDPALQDDVPRDRADPPAGRVRHQPDPGRRVPAGAGALVPGARAVAAPGGGGRDRRVRADRPHRAERAAGGGDGHDRAGRARSPTAGSAALRGLGTAVAGPGAARPGLAVSAGFALSVLATGGILLLAPAWRDALARWLPRWLAEAIAVPAAAQLACTPLVAAISGQVSLVAVVANLLVAPGGRAGDGAGAGRRGARPWCGRRWAGCAGRSPSWCVAWLIAVAEHGAALPTAAVGWGTGAAGAGAAHRC